MRLVSALSTQAATLDEALAELPEGHTLLLDHVGAHADALAASRPAWEQAAPGVRFVYASRASLMWPGAREVRVMGLGDDAARALLEEAAPGWLDGASSGAAEALLELLEGNPLALGFAARRARLLTPEQLLERLLARADVLRAPRLAVSLAAMLAEVWDALSEPARLVAWRARVFAAAQPVDVLERVLAGDPLDAVDVLDALEELDGCGALQVRAGRMRPSRLLRTYGAARPPEDPDDGALAARHALWMSSQCEAWLERAAGGARALLLEAGAQLEDLMRAWSHASAHGLGGLAPLERVVAALVTHRTSTMTQLTLTGDLDLEGVPPEVVLERADRMWGQGQTRSAWRALDGAAHAASRAGDLDARLAARLYGALARAQRELGLWSEAARSFEQVAEYALLQGDRARHRRYAWRQCEALLQARERGRAARVLTRLRDDPSPPAGAPTRERVALALAAARLGVDPEAARAALDGLPDSAERDLALADLDAVEGAYASALDGYAASADTPDLARRAFELACLTGSADASRAPGPLYAGVAAWIAGDAAAAFAHWRDAPAEDAERCALLTRAASGEELGEASAAAEPWRRALEAWSRDAEVDPAAWPMWPGEGGAGWLARVLALHPRSRRPHVSPELLMRAQREGIWFVLDDGAGFVGPTGGFVSLREKETLARVLAALLAHRVARPGDALGFDDAYAAGWPDQLHTPKGSARNRLRVAIRRLRDAGLRPVLLTNSDGYYLRDDVEAVPT